jgi:hypothetical protein
MKVLAISLFICLALGMPILCRAQRADDPAAAARINGDLPKNTVAVVEREARAGDAKLSFNSRLDISWAAFCPRTKSWLESGASEPLGRETWRPKRPWAISIQLGRAFISP